MKKTSLLLLLLSFTLVTAQTNTQNYIKTIEYLDDTENVNNAKITVQYFDGLGRPIQVIAHKQSPSQKDIITHIEYDEFGRQVKDYLPVALTTNNNMQFVPEATLMTRYGQYYGNANTYNTDIFYSEKALEA